MIRPNYNTRKVLFVVKCRDDETGAAREELHLACKHVVVRAIRDYKPKRIFCPECSAPPAPEFPGIPETPINVPAARGE